MDRYTRKDAEAAFAWLASRLGKTWSDRNGNLWTGKYFEPTAVGQLWTRDGNENRAHVGAWMLDYASGYGGFMVHEMGNEGGGVSTPFGHTRRSARDFCDAVRFAMDALAVRDLS